MAHDSPLPDAIPFRTLPKPSGLLTGVIAALVLVGVAASILGALTEPYRFWQGLLFNWLFWSSVAIGMVMFAVALHITEADWAWSIRRLALGGAAFLPISFVLLIVVFFGSHHYFHHWLDMPYFDPVVEAKRAWLTLPFLIGRDFVALIILYGLALAFFYYSLRPDVYGVSGDRKRPIYDRFTRGFGKPAEEALRSRRKLNVIAVVLALAYALLWGLIGIDLALTMEPHFFSTMFPVTFFWTGFHGGVAATAIAIYFIRPAARLEPFITGRQFHDLGKLLFGFSVFWMYLNWSQYVVIWYGLLPWEQPFFAARFSEPYASIAILVVMLSFVLPFLGLLTKPPKMVPAILAFFATSILLGHWLERFMITVPSIWEGEGLPLGLYEVGIGLGFAGLFLASYVWYARTFPLLPSPVTLATNNSAVVAVPVKAGKS